MKHVKLQSVKDTSEDVEGRVMCLLGTEYKFRKLKARWKERNFNHKLM